MRQTALETRLVDMLQPVAQDLGLEIIFIQITGEDGGKTVQITAEDPATGRLGIDKCAELSRAASVTLDVEDPIDGKYRLEVSSPGIDRLLIRKKDFQNHAGFDTKLETDTPLGNGQKRFRGILKGINDDDTVSLDTDEGNVLIPFENVKKAKLVLTDELIKASAGK